jgi:hypothetical protein
MKSLRKVQEEMKRLGHEIFTYDQKDFNLNIVGIRSKNNQTNKFDDWMVVFWYHLGTLNQRWFRITTDPGISGIKKPLNSKGVAALAEGQYRGTYIIGKHKGQYDALVQRGGTVRVYRDNDRDNILELDPESIEQGWFGINIHRAKDESFSTAVNGWSHGCQVFADDDDFEEFMTICKRAEKIWGNKFTYTLIREV